MLTTPNSIPGQNGQSDEAADQGLLGVEQGLKDVELSQARKRSRYTPEAKERTRDVRRKGACLRCRMLKLKCSAEDPCDRCLASATKTSERKVLSFCYCIRSRITEVNIFRPDTRRHDVLQLQANVRALEALAAGLHREGSAELEPMCTKVIKWLLEPGNQEQSTSIISFLASDAFYGAAREHVDAEMLREFRRLALSTSLLHTSWGSHLCPPQLSKDRLHEISHTSGSSLLQRLERLLSPQHIADCSQGSTQALFLVVVGTILAVSYSSQSTNSPNFPSELLTQEFRESPTLWVAMKEHLCHMLAHYLIFLASGLGHKLSTDQEQFLVENAIRRWNKSETFLWAGTLPPPREPLDTARSMESETKQPESYTSLFALPCPDVLLGNLPQSQSEPLASESSTRSWTAPLTRSPSLGTESEGPPRMFKRRRVIVVGPCDGHQAYARMITSGDNGRPSLFV